MLPNTSCRGAVMSDSDRESTKYASICQDFFYFLKLRLGSAGFPDVKINSIKTSMTLF